jgi:putative ABC transport system permease protein
MELWVGALNLGFLYAIMTMGVFITFRVHAFTDITVDGSFTAGAAAAAVLLTAGCNPLLALCAAFAIGAVAGWMTAFIHTRFQVNGLLAGILVMTAFYSINLHVMGRSNLPLLNQRSLFSWIAGINPGLHPEIWIALVLAGVMILFWLLMAWFFRTDLGMAMRVTGNNPVMAAANGIDVGRMTRFGVALANGFTGISGALVAQYQGFADIGMGIGTVVIGMAAVIIGESLIRHRAMLARVLSVIIGAVLFRFMIAFALWVGMNPIDLKLLTALFVLLTLVFSKIFSGRDKPTTANPGRRHLFAKPWLRRTLAAMIILLLACTGYRYFLADRPVAHTARKIGIVQLTENGLLNITRESLVRELARLGYVNGRSCTILVENAAGDLPTVSTILDKFVRQNVDVIVTISTGCTQVAINKIKTRPVVFATVANPFIIKAGRSDTDHLPNVTGVYGWVPMDQTLALVREILPGPITIGAIWDPAQTNSVFNVEHLQKAAQASPGVTFAGTTITSSAEVYEAAVSLVQKGIDAFVLSPDNIVYSAFESVVKAAGQRRIPIFMSDVERLEDGALAVLGYDYTTSGIQAAALVDRILQGESPAQIPFEKYKKLTLGLNLAAARANGISLSETLRRRADIVTGENGKNGSALAQ